MIKSQIIGDNANGSILKVFDEGEVGVVLHTHPPFKESRTSLPYRQYFTLDGTVDGDNNMIVNGATTPIEFCIPANPNYDVFIKFISIKIADTTAKLNEFGALPALANGVEFSWQSQTEGSLIIHDGLKDNLEFFRLSDITPNIVDLSGGGADAAIITWDLAKIFGNPWGLKLSIGTTEKIVFRVNDNLTGLDEFNIIGHGTRLI